MTEKLSRQEREIKNWFNFVNSLFKQITELKKGDYIYYEVKCEEDILCASFMADEVTRTFALEVNGTTINGIPYLYIRRVS